MVVAAPQHEPFRKGTLDAQGGGVPVAGVIRTGQQARQLPHERKACPLPDDAIAAPQPEQRGEWDRMATVVHLRAQVRQGNARRNLVTAGQRIAVVKGNIRCQSEACVVVALQEVDRLQPRMQQPEGHRGGEEVEQLPDVGGIHRPFVGGVGHFGGTHAIRQQVFPHGEVLDRGGQGLPPAQFGEARQVEEVYPPYELHV